MTRARMYDGTPIQAGVQRTQLTGRYPHDSIVGVRECVVVDRYFKRDQNNRSQAFIEYVVRDMHFPDFYRNVRRIEQMYGVVNGEENVLTPASKTFSQLPFDQFKSASDIDGDRVLLTFINGSASRPVIVGVLPHPANTYSAVREDGTRRLTVHNGTVVEIDKTGSYNIDPPAGQKITFGPKATATENFVLGQAWKAMMESFFDAVTQITVPTGTGPSGFPINSAAFTALKNNLDAQLSKFIFGQENED